MDSIEIKLENLSPQWYLKKKKKKAGRKRGESLFYRRIRANKYRINSRIRKPPSIHCDSGKN